jgi:hypothetical protein
MANKKGHRRFGNVRKLASGRFKARYLGPDGLMRTAPDTFGSKRDAEQWLTVTESDILRGAWEDPAKGRELFCNFGARWITEHRAGERTREEYLSLWRHHVEPYLGQVELAELSTDTIRSWRAALLRDGRSEDRTAKAYRLVRAILNTAVDDGRIRRNRVGSRVPGNIGPPNDRLRASGRSTRSPSVCPSDSEPWCGLLRSRTCGGAS